MHVLGGAAQIDLVDEPDMDMPEPVENVDGRAAAMEKSLEHEAMSKPKSEKSKGTGTKIADSYGGSSGSMLEDFGFFARR